MGHVGLSGRYGRLGRLGLYRGRFHARHGQSLVEQLRSPRWQRECDWLLRERRARFPYRHGRHDRHGRHGLQIGLTCSHILLRHLPAFSCVQWHSD